MTLMDDHKLQRIGMMDVAETINFKATPYKLKKFPPKLTWLCNFLWKILRKLKALEPYIHEYTTWTYIPASHPSLQNEISNVLTTAIRYNESNDLIILVGGDTFKELTQSPVFNQIFNFRSVNMKGIKNPFEVGTCYSYPIRVIPWMKGIIALPKEALK